MRQRGIAPVAQGVLLALLAQALQTLSRQDRTLQARSAALTQAPWFVRAQCVSALQLVALPRTDQKISGYH